MSRDKMAAVLGAASILAGAVLGVFGLIMHSKAHAEPLMNVGAWLLWAACSAMFVAGCLVIACTNALAAAEPNDVSDPTEGPPSRH